MGNDRLGRSLMLREPQHERTERPACLAWGCGRVLRCHSERSAVERGISDFPHVGHVGGFQILRRKLLRMTGWAGGAGKVGRAAQAETESRAGGAGKVGWSVQAKSESRAGGAGKVGRAAQVKSDGRPRAKTESRACCPGPPQRPRPPRPRDRPSILCRRRLLRRTTPGSMRRTLSPLP